MSTKKKFTWPQVLFSKSYRIKEANGAAGSICVSRSANIDNETLYIYGHYDGDSDYCSLSLSDARKLGRFIQDTIGL